MNKFVVFFLLFSLAQPLFAEECTPLPEKAEKFIKSYAKIVRGAESCQYRTIARGDVNSDGTEDLIMVFNIAGACGNDKTSPPGACGNHHETYLKIFLGKELKEVPVLIVGRRGERLIMGLNVANGIIQADTLRYGKDDPMCCPSIKGQTEFVFKNKTVTEKHPQPVNKLDWK